MDLFTLILLFYLFTFQSNNLTLFLYNRLYYHVKFFLIFLCSNFILLIKMKNYYLHFICLNTIFF